ncbi:hypothetical protein VN97_g3089 [Penicillium thymicola]|uniref:Uncharacterized protein n=1 Tax=Penicillium thymicola TaxID=293382 RepID=A0AAI9TN06_PENTH|nr:hypothetical protein VN97_g3089 [Penicillium thymicola]
MRVPVVSRAGGQGDTSNHTSKLFPALEGRKKEIGFYRNASHLLGLQFFQGGVNDLILIIPQYCQRCPP